MLVCEKVFNECSKCVTIDAYVYMHVLDLVAHFQRIYFSSPSIYIYRPCSVDCTIRFCNWILFSICLCIPEIMENILFRRYYDYYKYYVF